MNTPKLNLLYDPVCGMRLDLRINDIQAKYQDRRYYILCRVVQTQIP